jgi:SWI/SNF-related matrix-associated actin-dependent regulator 1 of chromatin subfamily A
MLVREFSKAGAGVVYGFSQEGKDRVPGSCLRGLSYDSSMGGVWIAPDLALTVRVVKRLQDAKVIIRSDSVTLFEKLREYKEQFRQEKASAEARLAVTENRLRNLGLHLYQFQREGVLRLVEKDRYLLADQMGLGKTIQAIVAAPEQCRFLVVCPAVAKRNWQTEIQKWRPEWKTTVLEGRSNFRFPEIGEAVLLNWEILPEEPGGGDKVTEHLKKYGIGISSESIASTVHKAPSDVVLVADEAHALMGRKTLRSRRFRALADGVRREENGRIWLLTATPLLNRPGELWNVLEAAGLAREAWGSWKRFAKAFGGRRGKFGMVWDGLPTADVHEGLERVSLRRIKSDVLSQLPSKSYKTFNIGKLSAGLNKELDKILVTVGEDFTLFDLEEKIPFTEISAVRAKMASEKISAMLGVVESYEREGEPLVVFSAHREPMTVLAERTGWKVITGDASSKERETVVHEFQSGKLRGLGATIQAGGVAITLTAGAHALFVDRLWTPALNEQAEDRLHRLGQTRGVLIMDLCGDHPLEKRLLQLVTQKLGYMAAL